MNAQTKIEAGTDIIVAVEATPQIVLLDAEKFDLFYDRVRAETADIVVDLSTKKGRDEVRAMAAKVTRSKTMIDKAGLALTKGWRDQTTQVNAARKDIETKLDALAEEVRRPLTVWEDAEKLRVNICRTIIDGLKGAAAVTIEDTAATVRQRGKDAWDTEIDPAQFGDMLDEAVAAKDTAVVALKAALARLTREEEERAELEKLRAEQAEREQAEAEKRAAEELAQREAEAEQRRKDEAAAAEKAKADREAEIAAQAEQRAKDDAERAAQVERDRIQREHDEAIAAERRRAEEAEVAMQAERDRVAKVEAERQAAIAAEAAEQAKRDKNRAHRSQIMGEAKIAIMAAGKTVDEAAAVAIVKAIVAGQIPHVSLRF